MSSPAIRSIARNTGYLTGSQFVGIATRLVWVVVAARILGPDLYALLAYSQAWQLAFLPLALFGIGPALAYLVGPDRGRAPELAAQALAIRIVTTALVAALCVALSRVIVPDPRAPALIAVLTLALIARAITGYTQTLFTAFEVNQHTMRQETVFSLLDLALALAILLGGGSLMLLVAARALVCWLQAGRALLVLHRQVVPVRLDWRVSAWRPLLALAAPALLITLAADWRFNGSLVLFRNLITDGVLFGQFALAMQALLICSVVPVALSRAAYPALRRAVARGDGKELLFASFIQRVAPLAGAAAGLMGMALGEPVFRLVLGDGYAMAGRLVGLTLWGLIPLAAGAGYPEAYIARGRFRALVIVNVAGAAVMTALMLVLAPRFGAVGAVAAAFAGFAVPPLAVFALACRQGLADLKRELLRPLAAAAAGLAAWSALAPVSRWAALAGGLLALAAASAWLGVVGRDELRRLRLGASAR